MAVYIIILVSNYQTFREYYKHSTATIFNINYSVIINSQYNTQYDMAR